MTDDSHYPADAEDCSDDHDHQHAVEACEHALDALENSNLSHARDLLDEARAAVERAQHDDSGQAQREIAYDCYE